MGGPIRDDVLKVDTDHQDAVEGSALLAACNHRQVAVLFVAPSDSDVAALVGQAAFQRGSAYQAQGMVLDVNWDAQQLSLEGAVRGSGRNVYECAAYFASTGRGIELDDADCTCPVGVACKHAAALLLEAAELAAGGALAGAAPAAAQGRDPRAGVVPTWRRVLDRLPLATTQTAAPRVTAPLGLQLRVDGLERQRLGRRAPGPRTVSVRPAAQGRNGAWSAGQLSWETLRYGHRGTPWEPQAHQWLLELGGMRGTQPHRYETAAWESLDSFPPRLLWPHLARAVELGIPLVGDVKKDVVRVAGEARAMLDVRTTGDGLRLAPRLAFDGVLAVGAVRGLVGEHGLFALDESDEGRVLVLGPSTTPVTDLTADLLAGDELEVPSADAEQYWADYHPRLARQIEMVSADASVELPEPAVPTLVVRADFESPTRLRLTWCWEYDTPRGPVGRPVRASALDVDLRDLSAEERILADVDAALRDLPALAHVRPQDQHLLTGLEAMDAADLLLPALAAVDHVRVDAGDVPEYTELGMAPTVRLGATETAETDWFDLAVAVEVDGRQVPLPNLLKALTAGDDRLLLGDGSWLRLNHSALDRLRELLDEASRLSDRPGKARISRHQASLWGELEELADVVDQSERWRQSVGGLLALATNESLDDAPAPPRPLPAPSGLKAELRPYQQKGFEWLAFCYDHGLGGILADDMGLGKTLQTLALVAHARERGASEPFLVVAPASVVGNWAAEAQRFAPGLRVAVRATTGARAAAPLAQEVAEADLVVTSYAIFRLDHEEFGELGWAGLVLDEAQFLKNHASRGNACARALRAPFKIAVTGTPMENDVTELWALLAVVAPGLYPSLQRFREDYAKPVEAASRPNADDDVRALARDRVARLRRRVRPLLLRRTKAQVAPELPDRQEQVLSVQLAPKHRRAYDARLQRERTRVLGLLDDFDSNRIAIFRSLTTLRRMALDATLVDAKAYAGVPSSKLDVLFEQLVEVVAEGHRALVFSQFTSYLDLVEERCRALGVEYARLDGSTRNRADVVRGFKEGTAPLFLVSLKAGGFGLNLTEADYVYLLDPWWNPATEAQAVDRTHRIGQMRSVMVFRLVASGTIEEKVMELKDRKARMIGAVLGDDEDLFSRGLSADDVRGLFDGGG
ncbi:DEAD/DEAH box helicase [Cellulosimicrobium sp. PMB13]|uniref:SNF2-related protein n=1 Tax=Cellulosimicrobium sp. PMB13 TaxID=3120158 RepID=UPI003F4C43DE